MGLRIGVDLGGTNLRVALVKEDGKIVRDMERKTEVAKGPQYIIDKMIDMIREMKGDEVIKGVGVGCPGPLDPKTGVIYNPPNLPGWNNIPLANILEKSLYEHVKIDNDANAAALAEAKFGAGVGAESVYYITVSTGVGGGFVLDGKVFQGAAGYAGEIGNMIILPGGPTHNSLNAGALESLASGTAIGLSGQKGGMSGGAEEVIHLASLGNPTAQTILDNAINYLAIGIANLVHSVNPSIFVLGGGVMKSERQLLEPIKEKVKNYVYPRLKETINIVPASLGPKAGVIGSAFLIH
ncbi:ROK family protein [Sutcliffiella horikoshii]|uniref:ROK family protein n=1 Tax=Sutcliffiella horikoshii TaxID=79883 RepID=A0A5D4T2B0_9BACI|nr:ROK family protein [Sutcliffiella horikoshii]TYS69820.1 ROK family protein [Sutcliffiella horikoshii]